MKKQWKGFLAGLLVAMLASSIVTPALGALAAKTIQVYTGVTVYVDDQFVLPTDANGCPVDTFVYNGTTYLPVRAIGNALGRPVQWDSKTNSVYIGFRPHVMVRDLPTSRISEPWDTYNGKDNLGRERLGALDFQSDFYVSQNIYVVDGHYSTVSGTLFQKYEKRNATNKPSTLKIYGDNVLLFHSDMKGGMNPVNFSVDITGVQELRIDFDSPGGYAAIADFGVSA